MYIHLFGLRTRNNHDHPAQTAQSTGKNVWDAGTATLLGGVLLPARVLSSGKLKPVKGEFRLEECKMRDFRCVLCVDSLPCEFHDGLNFFKHALIKLKLVSTRMNAFHIQLQRYSISAREPPRGRAEPWKEDPEQSRTCRDCTFIFTVRVGRRRRTTSIS